MATVNFIRYGSQSRSALKEVVGYVERDDKTEEKKLVSGHNCSPQFAYQEFLATRNAYRKESPVWFYHYTQSFSPTENVTGARAHELAKKFAARAWPDSLVLIATHTDAEHIHSHFIVSAVCHESGKMLRQGPRTIERLRSISDELCIQYGLSVLPPKQSPSSGMSAREYRSAEKGESWKLRLMGAIDGCMSIARSRGEFIERMHRLGYEVRWENGRANITYTTPQGKKCRDRKLHEEKYLKENMEHEFRIRKEIVDAGIERAEQSAAGSIGIYDIGADRDVDRHGGYDPDRAPCDEHDARVAADEGGHSGDAENAGADARGDAASGETGWEKEREALLSYMAGGQRLADETYPGSVVGLAGRAPAGSGGVSGVALRERANRRHHANAPLTDPALRAVGQGAKMLMEAGRILDDDAEDAEEHRRRIEAQEAAQNLGTAIGLVAGAALGIAEKHRQQEEPQQQSM